jgi:uncharacterized protein YebE (UPF0316 family)
MIGFPVFHTVLLPLLIFFARVVDVSLGTIRILFVARQRKFLAASVGFCEVLIWLLVITQVFQSLAEWYHYVAYAAGFATGNYVGILLEERLAVGTVVLRVITRRDASPLVAHLRKSDVGVTVVEAQGATGPVHLLFAVARRRTVPGILEQVLKFNPHAFYTIEDIRAVSHGIFPGRRVAPAPASGEPARKGK